MGTRGKGANVENMPLGNRSRRKDILQPFRIFYSLALPCQRPNRPGQYRYPFAEGAALHLPRVSQNLQRPQRDRLLSAAHLGRDRGARGDLARSWVSPASDRGGFWV